MTLWSLYRRFTTGYDLKHTLLASSKTGRLLYCDRCPMAACPKLQPSFVLELVLFSSRPCLVAASLHGVEGTSSQRDSPLSKENSLVCYTSSWYSASKAAYAVTSSAADSCKHCFCVCSWVAEHEWSAFMFTSFGSCPAFQASTVDESSWSFVYHKAAFLLSCSS